MDEIFWKLLCIVLRFCEVKIGRKQLKEKIFDSLSKFKAASIVCNPTPTIIIEANRKNLHSPVNYFDPT